jgi:hypothetical protein
MILIKAVIKAQGLDEDFSPAILRNELIINYLVQLEIRDTVVNGLNV